MRAVFHEAALQRFNHSRTGTPITAALERKIAHLEGGRETVCFATGRSAQPR
ncbi:PLP-dependent transferase [Burkholderia multivorans]|uniref:PLP-dependent transferase n=1 Tax=Burkholderia multivorans TaxID=87883 RepID=UPI001C218E2D|nr:PLP-dependent transferase [Burkholderia multivorans]